MVESVTDMVIELLGFQQRKRFGVGMKMNRPFYVQIYGGFGDTFLKASTKSPIGMIQTVHVLAIEFSIYGPTLENGEYGCVFKISNS